MYTGWWTDIYSYIIDVIPNLLAAGPFVPRPASRRHLRSAQVIVQSMMNGAGGGGGSLSGATMEDVLDRSGRVGPVKRVGKYSAPQPSIYIYIYPEENVPGEGQWC